jgi:hypothetical protein
MLENGIQEMARPLSLLDLPLELILDSLSHVDYTPGCLNALRLVCRHFNNIVQQYEHSLAMNIIRLQFPPDALARYPGLYETKSIGFKTLDELYVRLHTLFRLERNCHSIRRREGKEAAWMKLEWINLQQVGMHLLYRLCDAGKYKSFYLIRTARLTLRNRRPRRQVLYHSITTSHFPRHLAAFPPSLHPSTPCRRSQPPHPNFTTPPRHATLRSRTLLSRTHPPARP